MWQANQEGPALGTCLEVMRKLSDYLQDKLPRVELRQLQSHVRKCRDCALVLHSAQRTLQAYFDSGQHRAA